MRFRVVLFFRFVRFHQRIGILVFNGKRLHEKMETHTIGNTNHVYQKKHWYMYVNKRDWEMQFCIIIVMYDYGCINRELPVVCDII